MKAEEAEIMRALRIRGRHAQLHPELYTRRDDGGWNPRDTLDGKIKNYPPLFHDGIEEQVEQGRGAFGIANERSISEFFPVSEEIRQQIIDNVCKKLLARVVEEDSCEARDSESKQAGAPPYLISHINFREIVLSVLSELSLVPRTETIPSVVLAIRQYLERQDIMKCVSEIKIKNKPTYINYVLGSDNQELTQNTEAFEALINQTLKEIVENLESFIKENSEFYFIPNTLRGVCGRCMSNEIFNCIFVRLIENSVILPPGKNTNYSFSVDAIVKLRALIK